MIHDELIKTSDVLLVKLCNTATLLNDDAHDAICGTSLSQVFCRIFILENSRSFVSLFKIAFSHDSFLKIYFDCSLVDPRFWIAVTGFPLLGGLREPFHYLKNRLVLPYRTTVLPQKCCFCNFLALFGHFAENVHPQVDP